MILENYIKLKLWNQQIYINEDFSERTIEIRKKLFIEAKELRSKGKFAKVVYNKLYSRDF
jgi:hypothetical protein